jgi:sec-independent protein translocase protein TatA
MPNIGPLELIVILVVVLLLFGAKRLPELGRSLGSGMREFKDSVTGKDDDKSPTQLDAGDQPQPADAATRTETPVEAEPRT